MNRSHPFAKYMHSYFYNYLSEVKGVSTNTIFSYRDTLKMLLQFTSKNLKKSVDRLTIEDLKEKMILAFLNHIENKMGNSIQTRNIRLAAIRNFFGFIGREEPSLLGLCREIRAIPVKRREHKMIEYLDTEEMKAIFDSLDIRSRTGIRDKALLLILYNTGARVQEIADLTIKDLRLDPPYQVKLLGKGRKQRACPLWPETVKSIKNYIKVRRSKDAENEQLFLNTNGRPITRFGIRYIVGTYGSKASKQCSTLKNKAIGPHTFRHSTATHLIQAGNDINMVKLWLGHANINTTHVYVEIDMEMKRRILQTNQPPLINDGRNSSSHKWQKPNILEWLDNLSKESLAK